MVKKKILFIVSLYFFVFNQCWSKDSFYPYLSNNFEIDNSGFFEMSYNLPAFFGIDLVKSSTPSIKYYSDQLKQKKMPLDFAILPLIESGNNPMAQSNKNAVGLWQFMPRTAREWGLIPERYRDDRKNVILSTQKALDYLMYLYQELGDWNLSLMAYNWGIGSVKKALKKGLVVNGQYNLTLLPKETREYLLRFHGLKKVIKDNAYSKTINYFPNEEYVTVIKVNDIYSYLEKNNLNTINSSVLKHINGFDYRLKENNFNTMLVPTQTFVSHFSLSKISMNSTTTKGCSANSVYIARYGDNFVNLSKKYRIKVDYLKDINPGIIAIRPGLKVKLC